MLLFRSVVPYVDSALAPTAETWRCYVLGSHGVHDVDCKQMEMMRDDALNVAPPVLESTSPLSTMGK
jgi:hypothetical protein